MAIWRSKRPARRSAGSTHLRTVGGSHDNHWGAGVGFEAVNLSQQLVEGLLTLVIAAQAYHACPALANGINLVNGNDRRSRLAHLLERVGRARVRRLRQRTSRQTRSHWSRRTRPGPRRPLLWPAASCRCPGVRRSTRPWGYARRLE